MPQEQLRMYTRLHLIQRTYAIICKRAYTGDTFVVNGDDYDTVDGTNVRDYTRI